MVRVTWEEFQSELIPIMAWVLVSGSWAQEFRSRRKRLKSRLGRRLLYTAAA